MSTEYRVEHWQKDHAPNAAMLRQILVFENYTVFQWGDSPGSVRPHHFHPTDQSHWIISGSLELTVVGAGIFTLGPGDRDFLPAGTYYTARVIGESHAIYLLGEKP